MSENIDPIDDAELLAYVDGQLPLLRRLDVERRMRGDPALAARIDADLRISRELRTHFKPTDADAIGIGGKHGGNRKGAGIAWLARVAAMLAVGTGGWFANDVWDLHREDRVVTASRAPSTQISPQGHPSTFIINEALMSHKTAMIRARMASQKEIPDLDSAEIGRMAKIVLPKLPLNWRVIDVQLFPSEAGPSLQVTIDDGDGPPISLFAMRTRTSAPRQPETVAYEGESVSYWQNGELAYALTSNEPVAQLERVADDLADNELVGRAGFPAS